MGLPNQDMDFTSLTPLPASDLNKMVENIEALSDGTGLENGAVTEDKIANDAVTAAKIALGSCAYYASSPSQTTTSDNYVDITSASATLVTTGGALLLSLSVPAYVSVRTLSFALQINSVDYTLCLSNQTSFNGNIVGFNKIAAGTVPAGTYTVKARFHVQNAGDTGTIVQYNALSFSVIEI